MAITNTRTPQIVEKGVEIIEEIKNEYNLLKLINMKQMEYDATCGEIFVPNDTNLTQIVDKNKNQSPTENKMNAFNVKGTKIEVDCKRIVSNVVNDDTIMKNIGYEDKIIPELKKDMYNKLEEYLINGHTELGVKGIKDITNKVTTATIGKVVFEDLLALKGDMAENKTIGNIESKLSSYDRKNGVYILSNTLIDSLEHLDITNKTEFIKTYNGNKYLFGNLIIGTGHLDGVENGNTVALFIIPSKIMMPYAQPLYTWDRNGWNRTITHVMDIYADVFAINGQHNRRLIVKAPTKEVAEVKETKKKKVK